MASVSSLNLSDYDFSTLIPPKEVFDVQHDDRYCRHGEDIHSIRKIFGCVPYTHFENEKLKEFQAMIEKEGLQMPTGWTTANTLRFLYSGKFELEKSLQNLRQYLVWLKHPSRTTISVKALEILKSEVVYILGKDKQFRPIIIINIDKIDLNKISLDDFNEAICCILFIAEKYCFVPGKVENWIIIIETNNANLWSFPFKIIQKLIETTTISFTSTLEKLYIMNPSYAIKSAWYVIKKMLHAETTEKIAMLSKSEYKTLLEQIPVDQLEERYGGSLPKINAYWPPKSTSKNPPYRKIDKTVVEPVQTPLRINIQKESLMLAKTEKSHNLSSSMMCKSIYHDFEVEYVDLPGTEYLMIENSNQQNEKKLANNIGSPRDDVSEEMKTSLRSSEDYIESKIVLEDCVKEPGCCRLGSNDGCNVF